MNPIPQDILSRLIRLSHELGREDRALAILGEGNTSADLGDDTFLVKASGSQLGTIDEAGLTRVNYAPVLEAVDHPELSDNEVRGVLEASRVDSSARLPSVETFLHALCLREAGAKWVGHTHPASVLGVLSWNMGNKLVGTTNGVLFINFVPVTVFAIRIAQGHHFQPIEFAGAAMVIGALIANNVVLRPSPRMAQPARC